ncbi:MAG: hypothetical protein ACYTG4_13000, partial [Planctomycetota bacterium]
TADIIAFAYTTCALGVGAYVVISFKLDPGGDGQAVFVLAAVPFFGGVAGAVGAAIGFAVQLLRAQE